MTLVSKLCDILKITNSPLVSMDYIGEEYSAIVDTRWLDIINSELIKIVLWYDNEYGYCCNVLNQVKYISKFIYPGRDENES